MTEERTMTGEEKRQLLFQCLGHLKTPAGVTFVSQSVHDFLADLGSVPDWVVVERDIPKWEPTP